MKRVVFIMNPISGTQNKAGIPELIESTLDHEKFSYELLMTEHAGHASELAHEAMERGVDIVVAIGGDGTRRQHSASFLVDQATDLHAT